MLPIETREERTSSYNIMNKNKLNLSTARSEEFEHEFNDDFAWLGDKMKHQQRDRKDKLSIYNESPDNTKKFKSMQESESGSSIFKSSEENGSGDENDIGEIFNENIPEATIQKIKCKIKPYSEILRTQPDWNDYKTCEKALLAGIEAIKHNYSNSKYQKVTLKLSKDRKSLCYKLIDKPKSLFTKLRGERTIRFQDVNGFLFGAVSSTFQNKRKQVVEAMNFQRSLIGEERSQKSKEGESRKSFVSNSYGPSGNLNYSYSSFAQSDFHQTDVVEQ